MEQKIEERQRLSSYFFTKLKLLVYGFLCYTGTSFGSYPCKLFFSSAGLKKKNGEWMNLGVRSQC